MQPILKLLLFFFILAIVLVAGYVINKYFIKKITAANKGGQLIGYILLMILINAVLTAGGVFCLLKAYEFLSV